MGSKSEDDIAPNALRHYRGVAKATASIIWEQLSAIDAGNPDNNRCLVLMQSRIGMAEPDSKNDFARSRVWDMQDFPFAVGFLFYEYSKRCRIVQHSHVVFSTSRKSHVNAQHWLSTDRKGKPSISYHATEGYDCKVLFATVL
jgi:hypothetical protein